MFIVSIQHTTVTELPQLHVLCRQSSKQFSFPINLKVIPLFRYSVIPYSTFYRLPKHNQAINAEVQLIH